MARPFSDEDREKSVVTSEGHNIGTVRDVDQDRATVNRTADHDSLMDKVKDMLGWDDDDESHELRQDHVDRYEDDRVHLRPRR